MYDNETDGEKASRQIHKNAASKIEQVLEATPHKRAAIRPSTTHHENYQIRRSIYARHCWRSWDELISDVLLWIPSHGRAKAKRPARTYIQQLSEDTGFSTDELPETMNYRKKWRESVRDICVAGTTRWWWWWFNSQFSGGVLVV